MAMRKPTLMIAVGLGGPHGGEQDEDNLQRERGDGNGGDGDIATEAILGIVRDLHHGGPLAIRQVRLLARGLEDMCQAVMKKDDYALEEAAADARDALHDLISE